MKHYLLFYELSDDCLALRAKFRNEHLAKPSERGELLLGGALADLLTHQYSP